MNDKSKQVKMHLILELGEGEAAILNTLLALTDTAFRFEFDAPQEEDATQAAYTIKTALAGGDQAAMEQAMMKYRKAINHTTPESAMNILGFMVTHPDSDQPEPESQPQVDDTFEYRDLRLAGSWESVREQLTAISDEILDHPESPRSKIINPVTKYNWAHLMDMTDAIRDRDQRALADLVVAWVINLNLLRFETGIQLRVLSMVIDAEGGEPLETAMAIKPFPE